MPPDNPVQLVVRDVGRDLNKTPTKFNRDSGSNKFGQTFRLLVHRSSNVLRLRGTSFWLDCVGVRLLRFKELYHPLDWDADHGKTVRLYRLLLHAVTLGHHHVTGAYDDHQIQAPDTRQATFF